MFSTPLSVASILISVVVFAIASIFQIHFFAKNLKKLNKVRRFFNKKYDYDVFGEAENSQLSEDVADEGTQLHSLIKELNEYTRKNHGTTDFSIIQNKTDRKINILYEEATSKIAFPTYIGLMGTFIGVFLGLLFFTIGLDITEDGITDATIGNLISGVLVSMSTSFIGLLLTTISNHCAADTQKVVSEDKNEFYEFIQNELMPTLGVSMVAALNKLHSTINMFEPSFNRVIDRFQTTFDSCTQRFGDNFEQNVNAVSQAVQVMGENMDKINLNVDLQRQLLTTIRARGMVDALYAFANAAEKFNLVTEAVNRFELSRNAIKSATEELINTQKRYNESLKVPMAVANKLNIILNRVTDFENSINALGNNIKGTDLITSKTVEALEKAINSIKRKQSIAFEAMEVSDGHLESIFKMQGDAIVKLGKRYEESVAGFAERFETDLNGLGKEMKQRREEIVKALEEKFSLDQIQQDFSQLNKLKKIEDLLSSINLKSSREDIELTLSSTRKEVVDIHKTLNHLLEEAKKRPKEDEKASGSGFFGWVRR